MNKQDWNGWVEGYPAKVLEAIKGSWRKWDNIGKGLQKDGGVVDCPLCQIFYFCNNCADCPISIADEHESLSCSRIYEEYCRNETPENALAFRDWIGMLMPDSVVAELKMEPQTTPNSEKGEKNE